VVWGAPSVSIVTVVACCVDHRRLSETLPAVHVTGDGAAVNFPMVGWPGVTGVVVVVTGELVLVVEEGGGLVGTVTLSSLLPLVSKTMAPPISRAPAKIPPMIHHHFVVSVPPPAGGVGSMGVGSMGVGSVGYAISTDYGFIRPPGATTRRST